MFLKKSVDRLNQNEVSEQSKTALSDFSTDQKQAVFAFATTANELLEFRLFAIKHGHTYLSRIIEPVVKETLNIAHQLDQRFQPNEISEQNSYSQQPGKNFDLSCQELECLKWCSLGKTYSEIARETKQQEASVIRQMKSVRQKLNTQTDAHSVATLIRLKII